eukprot:CAMPEP_0197076102 /NCGR_PEP_ID=MMETSP1384-20130603/211947_1 /TAXON_ID=29189 /ORGANISM="Ammonia sp." /LENGTH=450 /DNA_ID=CAMNT_0042514951 /DNA_START=18 /DNA_END=1370 /DNA_ORIENTATION=+
MGNNQTGKKREKDYGVGIQKKMEEEAKKSQDMLTILMMGQGTVNFLNALQCISDDGISQEFESKCKAYIYHQMLFEMRLIIKNVSNNNGNVTEWSGVLYKHCVTDSLLIHGFIKSFMTAPDDDSTDDAHRYLLHNVQSAAPTIHTLNVTGELMQHIMRYYQSPDTVQNWLNILFFSIQQTSSIINHYILNHIDLAHFILDIYAEFTEEIRARLESSYDDSVAYYFQNISRICHADYVPSYKDIIQTKTLLNFSQSEPKSYALHSGHARPISHELELRFKGLHFNFINIHSMFRTSVKRWIYQFEDKSDALIFLVPLTSYYRWDNWDNFKLVENFRHILNGKQYLKRCSFHLLLSEKENFEKHIQSTPFRFAQYAGDNSLDSCIAYLVKYLEGKLQADNKGIRRECSVHVVSVFDLQHLKDSFSALCSGLSLQRNSVVASHPESTSYQIQI